jgi:hypothetical protein
MLHRLVLATESRNSVGCRRFERPEGPTVLRQCTEPMRGTPGSRQTIVW